VGKKDIKVGLMENGKLIGTKSGAKGQEYLQGTGETSAPVKLKKPGRLISRNNYPDEVIYHETKIIRLSPRGKELVADMDKVGKLPKGVILVKA
jgi:hypothetical protein